MFKKVIQSAQQNSNLQIKSDRPKTTVNSIIGLQKIIQANNQALQIIQNR